MQDAGTDDAHANGVDGGVWQSVDVGSEETLTTGGGDTKLAVDRLDDQRALVRAVEAAGGAQLGAEQSAVLQAEVGTAAIHHVATGGDRHVRGGVVRLEQAERATVDGDNGVGVERLIGDAGIGATATDGVASAGLRAAGDQHGATPDLEERAGAEVVDT